jgi:hypothetical protein
LVVYSIDGGFDEWKSSGLETVAGTSPRPFVKCFYDQSTGTCQFVVVDEGINLNDLFPCFFMLSSSKLTRQL